MGDRPSGEYQLFNLRLPTETLSRLHRYRDYLNQTQPGIDANVSMAARMLLFRALDQGRNAAYRSHGGPSAATKGGCENAAVELAQRDEERLAEEEGLIV